MHISVIIPVYNGGQAFRRCLEALWASEYDSWECIVVDDGSKDGSREIAREFGAEVVESKLPRSGPALARNLGVQSAKGELLLFIDSDVLVKESTLVHVASVMEDDTVAACIGSYDDRPSEKNFLSQYRNLLHHYTHQHSNREAATFWSGCGAIRRQNFVELGGFSSLFSRPSIEDIELGYRLKARGCRIILDKTLQVRHLKKWTVSTMLTSDIRDRAIPWARLILAEGMILSDLNLTVSQRISSACALGGLLFLSSSLLFPQFILLFPLAAIILFLLNRQFYGFLLEKRGVGFMLMAFPWHWLYFVYSGLSFAGCYLWHRILQAENPLEGTTAGVAEGS